MSDFESFLCLIDGKLVAAGQQASVVNPATAEPFATFHVADGQMVEAAVKSAAHAFTQWRNVPLAERRAALVRLADIVRDNAESLARLLTLEQGKPLSDAQGEIAGSEGFFRHYAGIHPERTQALFDTEDTTHVRTYTPLGVVAGIIPWNFPFFIVAMKVAPALLTGNVIIIKPSPTTPLTTLAFARLCAAHLPPGVLQVLGDDGTVGPMLTSHPGIRKISLTGSTISGRKVMAAAAGDLKRLTLELGGNDAAIVLEDADLALTAEGIFQAAFRNSGQVCGAVKRLYVHERVYEPLCRALADSVGGVIVGDGLTPGVTMGPVQNRMQYDKAMAFLTEATQSGRILAQAKRPDGNGYFVPPTLIGGLDDSHPLVAEEQFAPLLPVLRFTDEDDVIARANSTAYGLTASVWSADVARAESLVRRIDAALLCVNKHNKCSPSLGICMSKQSGTGWIFGDEGIQEYLQPHILFR